jgi:NTE family protein
MYSIKNYMKKSALVLSGGGGLGLAHIGALKYLEKENHFDFYAGVSAGAIVSAGHAVGYSAQEISDIIHSQNFFKLAFDFSGSNFGILRGKKVFQLLEETFQQKTFEDVKKEGKILKIYATDFQTGERVEISSGRIDTAVMASLSVPVLFEPLEYNGRWLTDGGLSGNFPIEETLKNYAGESIIGIDVATSLDVHHDFSQKKFFGKAGGIQKTLERSFRILFQSQQQFDTTDPRLKIFKPDLSQFKTIDIHKLKDIEKAGEECLQNFLA